MEIVKYLVERGANVSSKAILFESVLHYAAACGSLEIFKYLVERGADVHCKNTWNVSILHYAAQSGSLELVKYLVENGADVNCKDKWTKSVLHYAAKSSSLEIVRYLVQQGAHINCIDEMNMSILEVAAEFGSLEIVKYLVGHGADVNIGNETIVDYLFRRGKMKDIHDWDRSGRSLLNIACNSCNTAFVQTLLKYNVNVRKEKELVCGNEEILNMMKLELKKSIEHRKKIEDLRVLSDEKLQKVCIILYVPHACFELSFS